MEDRFAESPGWVNLRRCDNDFRIGCHAYIRCMGSGVTQLHEKTFPEGPLGRGAHLSDPWWETDKQ